MSPVRGILQGGQSFRIFFNIFFDDKSTIVCPFSRFYESWFSVIEYFRLFCFEFIIDVDNKITEVNL